MWRSSEYECEIRNARDCFNVSFWCSVCLSCCLLLMASAGVVWVWRHWGDLRLATGPGLVSPPVRLALPLTASVGLAMTLCALAVFVAMNSLMLTKGWYTPARPSRGSPIMPSYTRVEYVLSPGAQISTRLAYGALPPAILSTSLEAFPSF